MYLREKKVAILEILWEEVIRHGFTFRITIYMNKHGARATAHYNGILCGILVLLVQERVGGGVGEGEEE